MVGWAPRRRPIGFNRADGVCDNLGPAASFWKERFEIAAEPQFVGVGVQAEHWFAQTANAVNAPSPTATVSKTFVQFEAPRR
jgi:hypothetical protein